MFTKKRGKVDCTQQQRVAESHGVGWWEACRATLTKTHHTDEGDAAQWGLSAEVCSVGRPSQSHALPRVFEWRGSVTAAASEVRRDGLQGVFGRAVDVDVLEGDKWVEEERTREQRQWVVWSRVCSEDFLQVSKVIYSDFIVYIRIQLSCMMCTFLANWIKITKPNKAIAIMWFAFS